MTDLGSPPRARGKAQQFVIDHGVNGITPACAGKSPSGKNSPAAARDHPRACGEKFFGLARRDEWVGSPPRVRGKVDKVFSRTNYGGITPARAGKRAPVHNCSAPAGDHPRACGEKSDAQRLPLVKLGSPPRVRGKEITVEPGSIHQGITPARAGKSEAVASELDPNRDHPRACGEKAKIV